jgi:hypothetical protein
MHAPDLDGPSEFDTSETTAPGFRLSELTLPTASVGPQPTAAEMSPRSSYPPAPHERDSMDETPRARDLGDVLDDDETPPGLNGNAGARRSLVLGMVFGLLITGSYFYFKVFSGDEASSQIEEPVADTTARPDEAKVEVVEPEPEAAPEPTPEPEPEPAPVLAQNAADVAAEYAKVLASAKKKRGAAAEALYREAIALDPNRPEAVIDFAFFQLERGKNDEARTLAEKGTKLDPNSSKAWITLGASLQALNRRDEAKAAYRTCVEQGQGPFVADCRLMSR